jgi:hypothetical protein
MSDWKARARKVNATEAPAPAPMAAPEAPAEEPSLWERAREGVKGAVRSMSQTQQDMGAAALRGASLGLDDEIARLAARAGATVQRQMDSDDRALSGGGESVLESWRATAPLGEEALQERRAEVAAAKQRSPIAAPLAEAGAALATGIAAPGAQGGRLAQVASGAGTGAIAGAGMGDAEGEDAAIDALMGGGLGAGAALAIPAAAGLLGRARGVLRPRPPAPAAPAAAPPARETVANLLEEAATEGPVAILRKKGLQAIAQRLRPKAPPVATTSPVPELPDEVAQQMLSAADDVVPPMAPAAPVVDEVADPIVELVKRKAPAPVPETPAIAPDDVLVTPQRAPAPPPVPAPPQPATGPAGEVLTDLRRDTLGRLPTREEIRRAVEEVAVREGTTDIATLSSKIGVPTTKLRDVLVPMLRDAQFRARVASNVKGSAPASSALDEADQMGRVIRDAQQSARSPIDNVSGRPANQVAAVMQQERWRAAYDNLPPEQRAQFIEQLRNTSGLTDDAIRQRLKLTKAEWRRTSFERSKARSASPVLRPKAKAEAPPAAIETAPPEPASPDFPAPNQPTSSMADELSDLPSKTRAIMEDLRSNPHPLMPFDEQLKLARAGYVFDKNSRMFISPAAASEAKSRAARAAQKNRTPKVEFSPLPNNVDDVFVEQINNGIKQAESAIEKAFLSGNADDILNAELEASMIKFHAGHLSSPADVAAGEKIADDMMQRVAEIRIKADAAKKTATASSRPVLRKK